MDFGYARVSTGAQDLQRQIDRLQEAGIPAEHIYLDKKTGARFDRAGLNDLRSRTRAGDRITATNLDRFGRNLRECLNTIHELREVQVGLRTLDDPLAIDTSQTGGMADIAVALIALFAEMERVFMLERAASARASKKARGLNPGRPPKLSPAQRAAAAAMVDQGADRGDVAAGFGISRATLYRELAKHRQTTSQPTEGES
ncbi:MAG TPA: recombinase family protein [Trebonia sp.]